MAVAFHFAVRAFLLGRFGDASLSGLVTDLGLEAYGVAAFCGIYLGVFVAATSACRKCGHGHGDTQAVFFEF